jgi:hypothetical protein
MEDAVHLVLARPYDPSVAARAGLLPPPSGSRPTGAPPGLAYRGGEVPVHLSDLGYLSRATDAPANLRFPGGAMPAYMLSARLGSDADPLGPGEVSLGDIPVAAASGERDGLVALSWAGREIEIRRGGRDAALSSFERVFRGTVAGLRWDEETIHLSLRTRLATLSQRLVRRRYLGTGGAEGPPDLAGRPVPICAGVLRNVPLVLLDWGLGIHQAGEALSAVTAVRDRGLPVDPAGADLPSYAALAAASIPPGRYATCLALGLVRFGSPVTLPTADVLGDPAAGTTAGSIMRWVATRRMPPGVRLAGPDLDEPSIQALEAARPWALGLYAAEEISGQDALSALMRSVGGWHAATRDGALLVGLHGPPAAPSGTISAALVEEAGLGCPGTLRPAWRVVVGYRPMVRPLADSEMPETVPGADRATLKEAFRTAVAENGGVLGAHRDAVEFRVDTALDGQAQAEALAQELLALLGRATRRWSVPLIGADPGRWLGQTWILRYPRFGLDAGVPCVVVGLEEGSDGRNSLLLWGPPPNG